MSQPTVDPLLTFLRRMARRGTLAKFQAGDAVSASCWRIASNRDGTETLGEAVDTEVVDCARVRGLIVEDGADTWRLSRRGIAKLRGARTIADGPPEVTVASARRQRRRPDAMASKAAIRAAPRMAAPAEGSLEWLRNRRDASGAPLIGDIEYQAGQRLALDFEKALMQPRVTSSWTGLSSPSGIKRGAPGTGVEIGDMALAARRRLNGALEDVGPEFAGLLLDICCFAIPLTVVERRGRLPQRSAKVLLNYALRALARHYRMLPREGLAAADVQVRMRHWGAAGFRPDAGSHV